MERIISQDYKRQKNFSFFFLFQIDFMLSITDSSKKLGVEPQLRHFKE